MSVKTYHVDEHLLVVEKPTLLLTVPGRGPDKQECLLSRVQEKYADALVVHRLDWETSGLVVLARNKAAHRHLSGQFQAREVEKRYIAEVYGVLEEAEGRVELPLICDWPNRPRQMVDHDRGKHSLTCWERLAVDGGRSRVLLRPVTGRSHQLRVHMLAIGHPILGDPLYAHPEALAMAPRLLLHATRLAFSHPVSGEPLQFDSPPPF